MSIISGYWLAAFIPVSRRPWNKSAVCSMPTKYSNTKFSELDIQKYRKSSDEAVSLCP